MLFSKAKIKSEGLSIPRSPFGVDCAGVPALMWEYNGDRQFSDLHSDGGLPVCPPNSHTHSGPFRPQRLIYAGAFLFYGAVGPQTRPRQGATS